MFESLMFRAMLVGLVAAVIIMVRNIILDRIKSEKKDALGQFRKYAKSTKKQKAEDRIYGQQ